eukprot:CAMPEP_0175027432 /NCGR_PEP_ID=MMETSP0005-20121125/18359_1 /TAXON_ID=420556 /ORGANISM="Ochromonas sp., Strain CCMP1393" /LENGTH=38 /DNA_ID= /DNA_START= /DNA_END= /DNA_ORIENTATION=
MTISFHSLLQHVLGEGGDVRGSGENARVARDTAHCIAV